MLKYNISKQLHKAIAQQDEETIKKLLSKEYPDYAYRAAVILTSILIFPITLFKLLTDFTAFKNSFSKKMGEMCTVVVDGNNQSGESILMAAVANLLSERTIQSLMKHASIYSTRVKPTVYIWDLSKAEKMDDHWNDGANLLHYAAYYCHPNEDFYAQLGGISLLERNTLGDTPLHIAASIGNCAAMAAFLKHPHAPAALRMTNSFSMTPAAVAASKDQVEILDLIDESMGKDNSALNARYAPVTQAVYKGSLRALLRLLKSENLQPTESELQAANEVLTCGKDMHAYRMQKERSEGSQIAPKPFDQMEEVLTKYKTLSTHRV